MESSLTSAILQVNAKLLQSLIDQGINPNYPSEGEFCPLILACFQGNLEIVKILVENNAKLESKDLSNMTPLMLSVLNGHIEIVKYLVLNGANVNHEIPLNEWTPLGLATYHENLDIANFLISNGASVFVTYENKSLLYLALEKENIELATLLAKNGANFHIIPESIEIHPLILAMFDVQLRMSTHAELQENLLEFFIFPRDDDELGGFPLIVLAYLKGNISLVKILVGLGHINRQDFYSMTVLAYAVYFRDTEMVNFLLDNGAKVTDIDSPPFFNPLGAAVFKGHIEIVKTLIAKGASVNASIEGKALIDLAKERGHHEIAKLLFEHGSDFENLDRFFEKMIERGHFDLLEHFLELEPNSDEVNFFATYICFEKCLRIDLSQSQAKELLISLVKCGFKVNGLDGCCPLYDAICDENLEIVDQLIELGANINEDLYDGDTPLHFAITSLNSGMCKLLLDKGASYELRNIDNLNAIELAKKLKVDIITDLIIDKIIENGEVVENNIKMDDCVLCFNPRKEVFAFKPCNHAKTCQRCALNIMYKSFGNGTCPVCRALIKNVHKITNANDFTNFYI